MTPVTDEAIELLVNISAAVRDGFVTWTDGEEIKKRVLVDVADALGMPTLQAILARLS